MIQTYTNLMRRFADARPGLKLLAVEEAAIPVTILRTDVLVQEKKDLPATDEFLLRFIEEGVDSVDRIAEYLGLPRELVLDAAARQSSAGHVERKDAERFTVTALGKAVITDLVASQPALKQIAFVFDRLAWRAASYAQASLLKRSQALQSGMLLLPAAAGATITARDVAITDLNKVMRGNRAAVLRVNRLAGRRHMWAPAKLLVFGDSASQELELAVYIDDQISQLHENALQEVNAVARLQMKVAPLPFVPTPHFEIGQGDSGSDQTDVLSIEHLDHLLHAVISAKRRLMIASQSALGGVVTETFCRYLRDRARAGVDVTIIISDESLIDDLAAARLRKLANSNTNVEVEFVQGSGISCLVYDDVVIETNFDWLAGGKNDRGYSLSFGRLTRSERNAEAAADELRGAKPEAEAR